MYIWTTGV